MIGYSGDTGVNGSPHLHFEVRKNGVPVDPYGWQGNSEDPYKNAENVNLWLHPEIIALSIYCKNMDCSSTTVAPGDNLTFVYNISNPYSYDITNVRLGAQIRMNNTIGNWIDDPGNDKVVNLSPGAHDYSRNFTVSQSAGSGFYDARWVILNDTTGSWIDSKEMTRIFEIQSNARSGAPDYFGYTFKDSNIQSGPTYEWIDITSNGTMILNNSDDVYVDRIPVGFFFNFYGTDYSQVSITNNGIVLASGGTSQYINQPIGNSMPHNFIAPFWDDLVTWNRSGGPVGAIYYKTIGDVPNREFVVEWYSNQHFYNSSSGVTFEAILYEGTNNIKFQYKNVDFGTVTGSTSSDLPPYDKGGSATVGIEGPDGRGLQYSYNEQVLSPSLAILFKFPQYAGTNLYLSKQAPSSKDRGSTMTYALYYHNFGDVAASNVVLKDTLPAEVEFVSASDSGSYNSVTRNVTWNIGNIAPSGHGYENVTVRILDTVAIGTVIQNRAKINTSNLEVRYDDNEAYAQTMVTGSNLPPNVSVEPNNGGTTLSVYWHNPITFSYQSGPTAAGVDIRIHLDDGGPDITGSMTGGPPAWTYTVASFYPRHGAATVTYSVSGESCQAATTSPDGLHLPTSSGLIGVEQHLYNAGPTYLYVPPSGEFSAAGLLGSAGHTTYSLDNGYADGGNPNPSGIGAFKPHPSELSLKYYINMRWPDGVDWSPTQNRQPPVITDLTTYLLTLRTNPYLLPNVLQFPKADSQSFYVEFTF